MPAGPSFEADLRAVRESRDLSLEDLQHQTRIPLDVLRRFESGDLVGDPTYNDVYLRAFLQSYAKALGIAPSLLVGAFEDHKKGRYAGSLHPDFDPSSDVAAPSEPAPLAEATADAPAADVPENAPPPRPASAAPAVQALANTPEPSRRPALDGPPKTLAEARVNRPAVPSARRSFDKNWGLILGLFAAFVAVLGLALWFMIFRDDSPDDVADRADVAVGAEAPAAIDSAGVGTAASAGPRLQFPLRVTVTAGGDGLQWFRVTQDGGDRAPNWIDQGASQTFEADSLLVLWGEGNEAGPALAFDETTVELQGLRWRPANGSPVRISAQTGQALLDSLASAPRATAPAGPAAGPDAPSEDEDVFE